jgi:hypothetical protein
MTKPIEDKLAHAKREIKALRVQVEKFKKNDQRRMEMMRGAWLLRQKAKAVGEAREHMLRDAERGRGMDVDEANAWLKVKVQHLNDEADKAEAEE